MLGRTSVDGDRELDDRTGRATGETLRYLGVREAPREGRPEPANRHLGGEALQLRPTGNRVRGGHDHAAVIGWGDLATEQGD